MNFAPWIALGVSGASAGVWIAYFRWKDKAHPEPRTMVLLGVIGGAIAVGAALLGYGTVELLGRRVEWATLVEGTVSAAIADALLIGAVEECAKLLPVVLIARFSAHFDEVLDGIVYAGFAAVG